MRILQVSSAKNFGGGEKHLVDLCRGLTERGHEVFVAVRPGAEWLDRLSFLPAENLFKTPLKNSLDVFSARKLAVLIGEKRLEIVHAHLARDYPVAALAVRFAPSAKLILTRHVLFPVKFLQRFALSNVSRVIAVSNAVGETLRKTFPREKIVLISNGIEIERWSKADHARLRQEFRIEHGISPDALLVGTIGELKHLKGQEDFMIAAQLIAAQFPASHFVVVGKDNSFDRNFRRKLKRMAKIFQLEARFLWLDWVEDTAGILHSLDVFVSASHSESFGLSILEAMASGVGVVATETEGALELLENGETGLVVAVENPVELAAAVSRLLKDEDERIGLGRRAQADSAAEFGLEKMITETEKVYRNL